MKSKIIEYLSENLYRLFKEVRSEDLLEMEEIRIRTGKPVLIKMYNSEKTIIEGMGLSDNLKKGYKPNARDVTKTLELMSNFSLYSFEDELRNGYLTLPGGHRVGISGKTITEGGKVKTINHISGLNIRFSHEIKGCSDRLIPLISKKSAGHIMIISPPGCGKTTLLRDILRQISDQGKTVGIVDERSEIAGCYLGIPQNDVGMRTDVLDGCPKAEGMLMLLRSMAPDVIAVDEIGKKTDIDAIEEVLNAGVGIYCTVHGNSMKDIVDKPGISPLIAGKVFDLYILLGYEKRPGVIKNVYDKDFKAVNFNDH